jgi:hypothetical protein
VEGIEAQKQDSNFPAVIGWMGSWLASQKHPNSRSTRSIKHSQNHQNLNLKQAILSLASNAEGRQHKKNHRCLQEKINRAG